MSHPLLVIAHNSYFYFTHTYFIGKRKEYETRIGVIDVKSSPVQFSVEIQAIQHGFYGNKNEKVQFQKQVLNIGGGFDWNNQLFRAPYPGTYFFSLSGSKIVAPNRRIRNNIDKLDIGFRVNGEEIGEALSSENTRFGSLSYQVSLKLNADDKVELILYNGEASLLYFTGWMLDEDLQIWFPTFYFGMDFYPPPPLSIFGKGERKGKKFFKNNLAEF